jgi:hypothetical protein
MLKVITIAAVTALTLAVTVTSQPAYARDGGAVAAGVIGGLAVGAIIGSQANRGYYNGGPGYYESGYQPVYSDCRMERERFVDEYGRHHSRRIRVCD